MRIYGSKRFDQLTCRYGCCTQKYGKHRNSRTVCDRQRRKTARQAVYSFIQRVLKLEGSQ
jgi:hypothetical protein